MPKKRTSKTKASGGARRKKAETSPKFPYTTKPASLRRLLKDIPKKPKPLKFDKDLLRAWSFNDSNDYSMVRVLKAVKLLNDKNEPTELYNQFMRLDDGAKSIAPEVKRIYEPLFQASHTPYNENNETLQNLFHIHSGGSDRALDQQIQTFKALCENTSFDQLGDHGSTGVGTQNGGEAAHGAPSGSDGPREGPVVNINLHIHLPENKSRREYEDIIEDIGRYIFGRKIGDRRDR